MPVLQNIDDAVNAVTTGQSSLGRLLIGQLAASVTAGLFVLAGAVLMTRSRLAAYEQFRRATLINLFLTEFFLFCRIQFAALPSFTLNLLVLILLRYAMREERRLQS